MEDFRKILDQWESGRSKPISGDSGGARKERDQHDSDQMDEWLNRYPPGNKDRGGPEEDHPDLGGPDSNGPARGAMGRRRSQKIKIEDTLDLHGYRLQEAIEATGEFIEKSVDSGYRKVQVIHGKGADGQGVLRREIRAYLEHHQMTGTMGYGSGAEGGRGALWIILRERREPLSEVDRHRSR